MPNNDAFIDGVFSALGQVVPSLVQIYLAIGEEYKKAGSPLGEAEDNALVWFAGLIEKRTQKAAIDELALLSQDLGMYD